MLWPSCNAHCDEEHWRIEDHNFKDTDKCGSKDGDRVDIMGIDRSDEVQ